MDGIYLRRNWGGEFEKVAILVAIAVNEDGYREVLGASEGMKADEASWVSFVLWLRHVAATQWGNKKYMNVKHLEAALEDASIAS